MSDLTLVIGNRNYSSWSLRAWLALREARIDFRTMLIELDQPQSSAQIRRYSRAGRVPVLLADDLAIWDSLSIAEYAAELSGRGWPSERGARAVARSVASEIHSGFAALRRTWPMNIRARNRRVVPDQDASRDLDRFLELLLDCRARFGGNGPWLIGDYSIADAFCAPIVCRLRTYTPRQLAPEVADYCATMLAEPNLSEWSAAAAEEAGQIEHDEVGRR